MFCVNELCVREKPIKPAILLSHWPHFSLISIYIYIYICEIKLFFSFILDYTASRGPQEGSVDPLREPLTSFVPLCQTFLYSSQSSGTPPLHSETQST